MARTPKKRPTARKNRPARRKAARPRRASARARSAVRGRKPKKTQLKRRRKGAGRPAAAARAAAMARAGRRKIRKTRSAAPRKRNAAPARKAAAVRKAPQVRNAAPARKAPATRKTRPAEPRALRPAGHPPLDRARRVLSDDERLEIAAATARGDGAEERLMSSARSGHDALRTELQLHTESSPALTAGDPDAKWQDAYAVGDEAPGGDNPTPDQDRVDDIGKALGIEYQDNQELQGGEEVIERDRHRWELDPASSEDWPHDKKS
jgi:hypothetical protein